MNSLIVRVSRVMTILCALIGGLYFWMARYVVLEQFRETYQVWTLMAIGAVALVIIAFNYIALGQPRIWAKHEGYDQSEE
jgi:hypothetical protein